MQFYWGCLTFVSSISDITCPPAPVVAHAQYNSTLATFDAVIQYECDYGYWFPDRTIVKLIYCEQDGNWNVPKISSCIGIYSYFYQFYSEKNSYIA